MEVSISTVATEAPELEFTGERIVPGLVMDSLFREHQDRYVFAGDFVKGKMVLDVACGTGIGTQYLLDAGAQACIGFDLEEDALAYARREYPQCTFVRCDAGRLPLGDSTIDVVVSFETIEHLSDPRSFVMHCSHVLKPGGLFICSTPNRAVYRWYGRNEFHQREFFPAEFVDLLNAHFSVLGVYSQAEKTYPIFLVERAAVGLLAFLRLKEPIRKVFRGNHDSLSSATRFRANEDGLATKVKKFTPSRIRRPTYVLAVARKAL